MGRGTAALRGTVVLLCVLLVGLTNVVSSLGQGLEPAPPAPTGSIAGTVVDDQGTPMVMASVLVRRGDGATSSTMTGPQGRYTVNQLSSATYTVEFIAHGYLRHDAAVTVVNGQQTANVDAALQLDPNFGTISGRVTDAAGLPIMGVSVLATRTGFVGPPPMSSATTDIDGRYRIGPTNAADYKVGFSDPNQRYLGEFYDNKPNAIENADVVTVNGGQHTVGIDASLEPAPPAPTGSIAGTVVDDQGAPMVMASVVVHRGDGATYSTSTGPLGRYTVNQLSSDTYTVEFSAHGYLRQDAAAVTVVNGQQTANVDAALQLDPNFGTISGRVTDAAGLPVAGISVQVLPASFVAPPPGVHDGDRHRRPLQDASDGGRRVQGRVL